MLGRIWLAAFALAFALGSMTPASAQPQRQALTEPRIAFVVGNAGYQRGPVPQALNDAGLVAEALRSIGFEIVEGADLRQPDILRNFRDFLDKVQAAGPDAIAFVYFSGYGVSFEGDNYLIGTDARLDREGDIAIEGVRLSDLMRSLGEAPARAKVMMIDASRPNPFTPQGRGLAKGLAAMEPPQGMLVAFAAAPGSIAPDGQGAAYGPYATAIAEMLRAPGLDLDGVFTRIRARTHETTQGVMTPWYMSSLSEQIELVPPEAGVQAAPAAPLMRQPQPMRTIRPEEAYALAIEMDTLNGYVEFVETYPNHPLSRRVWAIIRARREALAWMRARQIDTPPAYWTYLRRYPNGIYAFDAERRLRRLSASFQPPPGFGALDFDVPPPVPGEPIEYVEVYEYREPPPRIMMAPPPAYIVDLPPPRRRTISPGVAAAAVALPVLAAPLIAPLLAPAPRRGPPPANANFTPGASGGVGGPPGGGQGQRWGGRGGQGGAAPGQIAPTQQAPATQVAPSQITPNVAPGATTTAPGTPPGAVRPPSSATLTPGVQPAPAQPPVQPAPALTQPAGVPPSGVAGRPPGGPNFMPGGRPSQPPLPGPAPSANVAPAVSPSGAQPSGPPQTQPPAGSPQQQQPGFGRRPPGSPPPGVAGRPPAGSLPPAANPQQQNLQPGAANRQPPPGVARQTPPSVPPSSAPPANRPPPPPAVANRPPPSAPPPAARQAPPTSAPPPAVRQAPPPQVVNRPPPQAAPPPRPAAPPPPPPPRVAAPPPPKPAAPPPAAKPPQCPPGKTFKDGACK